MAHRRSSARLLAQGVAFALAGAIIAPATAAQASPAQAFIVQATSESAAAAAVVGVGGHVTMALDVVDGVAARLDQREAAALSASGTVTLAVDTTVRPTGADFGGSSAPDQSAVLDLGLQSANAGEGVGVALVDTGVAAGASASIRHLVIGPDLSGDSGVAGVDHYGHGTFMAGLIAGAPTLAPDGHTYSGVAPGATLISVKVAGADGSTSLSKVIGGIGWVVAHRDALHIRVLNLSMGVDLDLHNQVNPLDVAVEATWAAGITVVSAAGNDGAGHVTSPGDDPWIITAGALATNGPAVGNATAAPWSGTATGKPDVLAPGVHVVSLRAPGSTIDLANPSARVGDGLFRGSGTSMATALTSGAAAILIASHPGATPDDVKGALVSSGAPVDGSVANAIDVAAANAARSSVSWVQHHRMAFDLMGLGLSQTMPWVGVSWTGMPSTGVSWTGVSWTGVSWTGVSWTGVSWTGVSWTGVSWTGVSWTGVSWTGVSWTGVSWTGVSWTGVSWTGVSWTGVSWTSHIWG
jgi:serine protease AprX